MDKPMPNIFFKMMCFNINLRNKIKKPEKVLLDAGVKPGYHVLDYGCGPGDYALSASRLVGGSGQVYALDIQPLAKKRLDKIIDEQGILNLKTIVSNCVTGLEDNCLDLILLYDIFHMFKKPSMILKELYRILKPGAVLSVNDHHMKDQNIIDSIIHDGLFSFQKRGKYTFSFKRVN